MESIHTCTDGPSNARVSVAGHSGRNSGGAKLIKAGAFDSLAYRAPTPSRRRRRPRSGPRVQRDRAEARALFDDLLPAAPPPSAGEPTCPSPSMDATIVCLREEVRLYIPASDARSRRFGVDGHPSTADLGQGHVARSPFVHLAA